MLKILRIVLPIIVLVLAGYSLVTGNHEIMPYLMFFMGSMFLVMGIYEIKKGRTGTGVLCFIVSLFVFIVSVQDFLAN